MKRFRVENTRKLETIYVNLNQPPYENENVLNKTGWKVKDCLITEVFLGYESDESDIPSQIDYLGEEE
jgi:hypothetical protein